MLKFFTFASLSIIQAISFLHCHLNLFFNCLEAISLAFFTTSDISSSPFNPTEADQSSVLGAFFEFKDFFSNELASLSSEQLCCLCNTMGFIMVFGGMVTVTSILFGQYLIDYFNLEKRYPKLARYLKLKQTLNKYYLIFNIIYIYLILILFIVLNTFMGITA